MSQDDFVAQSGRGQNVSDPEAGCENFRERTQVDHVVIHASKRIWHRLVEIEQTVWIVFENQNVFALTDFDYLRASLFCERDSRRVGKVWHQVEKLDSSPLRLHSIDCLLQRLRRNPLLVCVDVFDVSFVVPKDSDCANIRRPLGKNYVALVEKKTSH